MFRRIAAVLVVSMALIGTAQAVSGVAPTNLTIKVKDGRVFGMLAGRPECRVGQTIDLVVNGAEVDSTTTGDLGRYSFTYDAAPGSQVRTEFDGAMVGVHPDTLVCRGSVSRTIVVRGVLPAGGTSGGGAQAAPAAAAAPGATAFAGSAVGAAVAATLGLAVVGGILLFVSRRAGVGRPTS